MEEGGEKNGSLEHKAIMVWASGTNPACGGGLVCGHAGGSSGGQCKAKMIRELQHAGAAHETGF